MSAMTETETTIATSFVDIDEDNPGRIAVFSDYRQKDSIKAVPGARWDNTARHWHVPLTWGSCIALRTELGHAMKISPALAAWAFAERERKDAIRSLHTRIATEDTYSLPGFESLYPYQTIGAQAICLAASFALFDETGAGKSRTSLAGLALAKHEGATIFPLLIVAPKSMLLTWARDEVPNFFPDATISVIRGTPTQVRDALEPGADVYITTYDTIRRYSRHAAFPTVTLTEDEKLDKELNKIGFKSIIADEAHRVKNPTAKQTRALWQLGKEATQRITLSGSPMQESPEDLWSILRFLSPEEFPTKTSYVERFLNVSYDMWGGRQINGLNPLHEEEFRNNIDTRYRRVTKEVVLPFLPPKIHTVRWVELPPKLRKAYDSMVKTMVAELQSGDRLAAKSSLERAGRLTQLANASGEIDAAGQFKMAAPSPKIDAFMEDIDAGDYDGQQIVVFSDSRQLIDLLSVAMTKKKIGHVMITGDVVGEARDAARDAFQAGEVQFILLTRAGGEGITLTAASTMVRLVRSWSLITHTQSEDRVHRIGSEKHEAITYVDYITDGTVEVGQLARLNGKKAAAEEVFRDADLLALLKEGPV